MKSETEDTEALYERVLSCLWDTAEELYAYPPGKETMGTISCLLAAIRYQVDHPRD